MPLRCSSCLQTKASLKNGLSCGLCQARLCKECTQFLEESYFSFLRKIPPELTHTTYCGACYERCVVPAMGPYEATLEKARNVYIFEKGEKHIPLIRRCNVKISMNDCKDRKEMLLRLAFLAAEQGYNAVINVEVASKKINLSGYQTSSWSGFGFPAEVMASRLRDDIS